VRTRPPFQGDLESLSNVAALLGSEGCCKWDHVVAQHTVAKGEIRVVAENVAEFVRVVRTELDLALAERALDLRFERVDELQVVRDTDQTDARLVDRGVLARLGTREIVEEVVAGVRRDVVDPSRMTRTFPPTFSISS